MQRTVLVALGLLLSIGTAPVVGAFPSASAQVAPEAGTTFPTPSGQEKLSGTKEVSGVFDGKMVRYYGLGDGSQDENQPAVFVIADGGTLKNAIIGDAAGDGVHCMGTCTIENVWWEDVGEDAATLKQQPGAENQTLTVIGGGAMHAADKVFQNNAKGGTFVIKNFYAKDIAKLIASCGNCANQGDRKIVVENVLIETPTSSSEATAGAPEYVIGLNANYHDSATVTGLVIVNGGNVPVCVVYNGNTSGAEPDPLPDDPGSACAFTAADVIRRS